MAYLPSLRAAILPFLLFTAEARRLPAHQHEAVDVHRLQFLPKRQIAPLAIAATTTLPGVLTLITPSPGASPVQVTKQSQIVTSYVPQFTLCELPPIEFFHVSPQPSVMPTTAPYKNYSISIPPGNGSCTTIYSETRTMVCATVLSDLTTTYTVSQCPQDITFSTRFGYALVTPTTTPNTTRNSMSPTYANSTALITPAPTMQTLTTYYIAPWQELTSAGPPGDVDLRVCAKYANGTEECIRQYQVWRASLVTINATTTSSINFTTTIAGPSQVIVETFVANITEVMTTFSMSTTMELLYETEIETTSKGTRAVSTEPTVYETRTVLEASTHLTSTITKKITSTITAGTKTITLPDAQAPPGYTSTPEPDFASMLGIGQ